jgi:hypothetical protein
MLEVAVWSIQPDIREMGTPDEAIPADTEHALICNNSSPFLLIIHLSHNAMGHVGDSEGINCCAPSGPLHAPE